MLETSVSLLEKLRQRPDDDASWRRLLDIYTPFMQRWLHHHGVQRHNSDDLVQDVLAVLVRELPRFEYDRRQGTFRGWLRMILVNRLRELWRTRPAVGDGGSDLHEMLQQLEDPNSGLSQLWEAEHDQFVVRRLMTLLEPEFEAHTWRAFQRQMLDGVGAAEVARELGMSVGAVYVAKSRVMRRLREELQGLVENS